MNRKVLLPSTTLICAVVLFVSSSLLFVQAQNATNAFSPTTNINFTSATQFPIPTLNSTVSFSSDGSYANASLDNGAWDFTGLFVNGGTSALPDIMGVGFSVSAQDCDVTITHLDALNVVPPLSPGELDYTVAGVGSQSFNLHYSNYGLLSWTVYIDGVAKPQNNCWTVSADGTLTITGAVSNVSIQWAEASLTAFTPTDNFANPAENSTVNFGYNGTYMGTASLTNNVWYFQNLAVNGSTPNGIPLWDFAVSAENCEMTITSYNPGALTGRTNVAAWLNYAVAGVGTQAVNLNYGSGVISIVPNCIVCIDGENRTQGDGWSLLDDGWVIVTGAASNVSIYYPPIPAPNTLPPDVSVSSTSPNSQSSYPNSAPSPTSPLTAENSAAPPQGVPVKNYSSFYVVLVAIIVFAAVVTTDLLLRLKKTQKRKFIPNSICC